MSEISDKELLTVADVAGYMGVGQVTVHRWSREGRLPCPKVGKSWRIRLETLENFVRRGSVTGRSKGSYGREARTDPGREGRQAGAVRS